MALNLLSHNSGLYLNQLDWEILLEKMKVFCHFEASRMKFDAPLNSLCKDEIKTQHNSLDFFIEKLEQETLFPLLSNWQTLDPSLEASDLPSLLAKGRILNLKELNELAKSLEAYILFYSDLSSWVQFPLYALSPEILQPLKRKFISRLRIFMSSDGTVDYSQHPLIKQYHEELLRLESTLRATLRALIQSPEYNPILQFHEYDLINDRYVLAVRSDSYQSPLGQIISRSESGQTLYVEPFTIKDRCNHRISLLAKIDEIITKVCRELTEILSSYSASMIKLRELFEVLDYQGAKARFCFENNFVKPEISETPQIEIYQMFHPLLKNPVKNDLTISEHQKGLILSGPNTGGKTVALKTLGLCHLFLHFGLYLPASYAKVYPFPGLFYFGHDQQNLPSGLSSFSAEVKSYLELLGDLQEQNLIIIDEIFSSTSSEEASALALGLFEEIHHQGAKIFVSTHHQMLKVFMQSRGDYLSGHVGFDLEKERPTYKIILGMPGSSMALSIFSSLTEKLGISQNIVSVAKQVLEQKAIHYEALLQEVSQKGIQLDQLLGENQKLKRDLNNQQKIQEGVLKLKMEKTLKDYEDKMNKYLAEAKDILEVARKKEYTRPKSVLNQVANLTSQVRSERDKIFSEYTQNSPNSSNSNDPQFWPIPSPEMIEEGLWFYSLPWKVNVQVKSYHSKKDEVVVKNKSFTLKCTRKDLRFSQQQSMQIKMRMNERSTVQVSVERSDENAPFQVDCRGMRSDEFEKVTTQGLTDLALGKIPFLLLIHGHGTGALKTWLRNYLKQNPEYSWDIPKEYCDGATRIFIEWPSQSSKGGT